MTGCKAARPQPGTSTSPPPPPPVLVLSIRNDFPVICPIHIATQATNTQIPVRSAILVPQCISQVLLLCLHARHLWVPPCDNVRWNQHLDLGFIVSDIRVENRVGLRGSGVEQREILDSVSAWCGDVRRTRYIMLLYSRHCKRGVQIFSHLTYNQLCYTHNKWMEGDGTIRALNETVWQVKVVLSPCPATCNEAGPTPGN